ncbi:ATP-dependent RNA helicase HrpA [Leifsonia sp. McL0608]|uniref:ATP-dependent RNA helicase HrpA n=1 Tax=Leifsonia sp. McL0608 TaxID=3143537 RepID=UPI003D9C0F3E
MVSPARLHFPPELPVSQKREDIARAIRDHQVVIVAGETGSGKTTQLPKICLELGRESIGHTQPRRIAARTIAERIAEELGEDVGGLVGYQVRFTDRVGASTRIKLMTDGILLNEIHRDRMLRKYDTIIIDEAHERSLNIDFLIGYLRELLPKRPDLKVIVTSATIDPESFARHFASADGTPAPVIEVSGRTFPVEVRYRPLVGEIEEDEDGETVESSDRDYLQGINDALDELARESSGDVLVFLSGENEIRDAADAVRGRNIPFTEVLPLYGRLSSAEQHRVFQPSKVAGVRRRIVLATNVAETSLTVPGIKYVVDAGTARISRYSVRAKVQRLPIEAISQASANQRSGRSGRTSDGIAIRLYSQEDFEKRPEFTEPEILRTNLAAVILQMISLGLGDIAAFPFLTPPDSRGIKDGLDLLAELNAIVQSKAGEPVLTRIGRQLAQLPIDPRFARMVVESKRHGTSREVMAIVAGLTIQDPRERPVERRGTADEFHARFADPTSDFLTLLNLWNYLEEQQRELSSSAFRRLCKTEFLNFLRVREWQDVYRQLRQLAKPLGLAVEDHDRTSAARSALAAHDRDATDLSFSAGIHKSLLAGLLSHIGIKDATASTSGRPGSTKTGPKSRGAEYIGARQAKFVIFPGSTLAKRQPNAVMSAELVETSRLFARMNAAIDPAWAEPIAGDLCKRNYSEPHWEKSQGAVVAYERVTLFGVPIVPRRRVQYSRIDQELSRELFIRHALVEGEWDSKQAFDRANRALRAELRELEERTRRRDILNDDEAVFDFYDRRIPADVVSTRSFEGWWRKARAETPDLLTMTQEALLAEDSTPVDDAAFPPVWQQGDQRLTLRYRFEPGAEDDGVTVQVPLPLLAGLRPEGFDWQVPGLRHDLVTALIKSLPKSIRRQVVPAADWAKRLLGELADTAGMRAQDGERPAASLPDTLAAVISRLTGSRVSGSDFDLARIPGHLRPTFDVIGERGRVVASGKDLPELQDRLRSRARESVVRVAEARTPNAIERVGLTTWDLDELPRYLDTEQKGPGGTVNVIRAYPALVDEGASVSIRLMGTPADQAAAMPGGARRLLLNAVPSPVAYVQQHLTSNEKLTLAASPYPSTKALFDDCLLAVVDSVLYRMKPDGQLFMRAEFEAVRDRVSAIVMDAMFETVALVTRILTAARAADKAISGATSLTFLSALNDAKGQLAGLVYPGFVSATGLEQLRHLPRYLNGIGQRMAALPTNPARDRAWMTQVETAAAMYADAGGRIPPAPHAPPSLVHARWMLEEFRVSLFAQSLGTAETVSVQRIRKVLEG